jgi:[ribosomal protein S5]-alanine N-acetyltransferase
MPNIVTSIKTKRLTLRSFTLDDAPFIHELLNDPDWIRFIGDRGIRTLDDARRQISEKYMAAYARDGFGLMLVVRNADGASVGMCGLIRRVGLDDVDIGFAFLLRYRGQGIALEAARAALAHGGDVLKLTRVVGITLPANVASISLMEKIGLTFESQVTLPNDPETLHLYGINFA